MGITKTYTSAVDLTRDTIKYAKPKQKYKLYRELGYTQAKDFVRLKNTESMVKRGGGMILRDVKNLNKKYIERKGGSVTINW